MTARFRRQLVENPGKVIIVDVDQCASCHHDLTGTEPSKVVRRQVTELPEIKPIVFETQQMEKTCPHCQHLNRAELPAGLEADRFFGPRLEATIVFLKHQNHFSYERIVNALREVFGLEISEGVFPPSSPGPEIWRQQKPQKFARPSNQAQ